MGRVGILSNEYHNQLDLLLKKLFEAYKKAEIELSDTINGSGSIIGAIDIGNKTEIRTWVYQDGISLLVK